MHLPKASWTITGLITDRRILTSQKNAEWSQPMVKVQTLGDTYEVSCTKEIYAQMAEGELLELRGEFERRPGREGGSHLNFVCKSVSAAAGSKGAA